MRQLHLVGFTSDHDGIILAGRRGSKTGGYVVTMDEEFLEQLDQARRMQTGHELVGQVVPEPSRARVESALSPRDIQTRLRAGRTVAQVATEAGVSIEWVERFAAPVLAEQAAAVERAYATTMRTQRRGHSDRPLGPSVLRNLADRGIRLADDEFDRLWTAFQLAENEWVIRFRHRWRGRELDAEWLLDDGAGSLTPGNRQATELGYVDPGRHAPPVKGLPPMRVLRRPADVQAPAPAVVAAVSEAAGQAASPSKARKSVKKARPARRATRPLTAKKRPTTKKAIATKKSATRKSPAKKTTVKKTTAKKTAAKKRPATRRPATRRPAATKRAGTTRNPATTKKAASKGSAAKKRLANKTGAKKTVAKRSIPRKPVAKKATTVTATSPAPRRERPLKAVRIGHNGKTRSAVRTGRVSTNGTASRRAASVSRAGGNGSRRSRA